MVGKSVDKKEKKRKWYEILSKDFNNAVLGETITKNPNFVINSILRINLSSLDGNMKSQNAIVLFKVNELKDDKFYTNLFGYELVSSYVKRIIKNKKTKIDDSFICTSKDGVKVRVKPLLVTRSNVNRSLATAIRNKTIELFKDYLSNHDYNNFFMELLSKKFFGDFKKVLNKIYPLSVFEVRIMKRL